MAFLTADEIRTRTEVIPTTADLDSKYGLVQGLITTAADDGQYTVIVTIGSDDQTQFTSWLRGYGYRVIASDQAGTQVRKLLGTAVNLKISWQRYAITVLPTTVAEGGQIVFTVATKGVSDGAAYWQITGSATQADFTPTVSEGTVNIASGTGSVTLTIATDIIADPGETVTLKLYADQLKSDLVATAPTVTIT